MKMYLLMNKNEKLLSFSIDTLLGSEEITEKERFSSFLPTGFVDIATWIDKRDYAKHKEHFQAWLKDWGIDSVSGFIDITHCLGLNDCLWVKPEGSLLNWEDVNLYNNEFTDVASRTAFDTGLFGLQLSSTSPEFTAEGSFPKFWKRENNRIFLYKAGASGAANVGLEPYSEYISSHIASQISDHNTVLYDLIKYKNKTCSKCAMFTNEDIGFIPFYKYVDANKHYTISNVISICRDMGYERKVAEMFFIDSIVFNQDRHLGNFGFLVDNESFEVIDFAPLFDFNISMLCNAMEVDLNDPNRYFDEYRVGHKLGGTFEEVGIGLRNKYGFSLSGSLEFPIHFLYNMDSDRLDKIQSILESNANKIENHQVTFLNAMKENDIDLSR